MQLNKNRHLLLVYPADMRLAGKYLSEAYSLLNIHATCIEYSGRPPAPDFYRQILSEDVDAVLVAGKKMYAPSTVLPGPFLFTQKKKIPAAWLPLQEETDVFPFIQTLKKCTGEKRRCLAWLLAQWHPQYLRLTQRMTDLWKTTFRYSMDRDIITREDVVNALGCGLGMGIYFGHGRSVGWVGYYGMRSHHFESFTGIRWVAYLYAVKRQAVNEPGFLCGIIALMGILLPHLAVRETRHTDNMKWAIRICDAVNEGIDNLGDLLIHADHPILKQWSITELSAIRLRHCIQMQGNKEGKDSGL